jgi:hypothetical protein
MVPVLTQTNESGTSTAAAVGDQPRIIISKIGIAVVFLIGVWLRFRGIGAQIVFSDEIHALNAVRDHGYRYLFTHFAIYDACIPLTVYYRVLLGNVGLNELSIRLPSLLAGCATILLVALFAWRRFGPVTSLLASGILALSPYHVYLSREARPYPIVIFLILVAIAAVVHWTETSSPRALLATAPVSFLAIYFHLLALPLVAALYGFVLLKAVGRSRQSLMNFFESLVVFVLLCLAFFVPAAPSLLGTMMARSARGVADAVTYRGGMYLFTALSQSDWIWQIVLAGAGTYLLARQKKLEALLFPLLLGCQVAAVWLASPYMLGIPWVWARYVALALPLWIMLIAAGLSGFMERIRIPWVWQAAALLLLAGVAVADRGLYGIGANRNYIVHPIVMLREFDDPAIVSSLPVPAFYRHLAQKEGSSVASDAPRHHTGAILEMPLNLVFPLYDIEQRVHGRPLYTASMGPGLWQEVFDCAEGFRFNRTLSLSNLTSSGHPIEYVVVHKAITNEMKRMYRRLGEIPAAAAQLRGYEVMVTPEVSENLFGHGDELQRWATQTWGQPEYEDADVAVYRFKPVNAPCPSR